MKEKPERKYTYDAFISYRHAEPDKFIAENLHRCLEAFKPPKSIIKSGKASRERIERVFRDKEELPITNNLEDPIVNALMQSEYLIVIC
ncbi:MAG: toll/interleukin-1 receptor domain-containing protein, partial [Lachnospiraceae bacterium]|nr:toll/interleukin-1 receptor domain-containing protein [Lachnospiraceae bacterium]